jgi:CubicO group peptidase (beta-lactamase class C family)
MFLKSNSSPIFAPLLKHVTRTFNQVICSGAATIVIHNDSIVLEEYIGQQSKYSNARKVQADTQFHVASVRKSYIGFAVAYAVYHGHITSIDDLVLEYMPELEESIWKDTSIRHLLTHTHGLDQRDDVTYREYPVGEYWTYRQVGISVLTEMVKRTTNKTVSDIVHDQVFKPLHFSESNWYAKKQEKLADVILRYEGDEDWETSNSTDGSGKNMYVSARELAYWGYLHLNEGYINGKQIVPKEILQLATTLQSPANLDENLPQNGFLWFVKDLPAMKTEIG